MDPTTPSESILRRVRDLANSVLAPTGMMLLPRKLEAEPTASSLRLRLFRQVAATGLKPRHIIDVGAHQAAWSRDAHSVFRDCAFTLSPQLDGRSLAFSESEAKEIGYASSDLTDLNRCSSDGALGLVEMAFAKKAGVLRDPHGW